MATSGSRDFNLDVAEIVEEAYERCGLEARSGYDLKTARRSLNLMFADWANRGLNLWTVTQTTQALTAGTSTYTLGADVVDVLDVALRRDGTDYELNRISRGEYLNFPDKTSQGRPSQFFFDRQIQPQFVLWQTPDSSSDTLVYYYIRRIEDVDSLTNNAAVPFRFLPCAVSGLAYYLSVKRAPERMQLLKAMYDEDFLMAAAEDVDRVPLKLVPGGR
jgi:hypothetical protein